MIRPTGHRLPLIVTAICLLGVSGCGPQFRKPLSNGETSEVDEQLLGTWYLVTPAPDDEPAEAEGPIKITKAKDGKTLEVRLPEDKADGGGPWQVFRVKVGEQGYLSVPEPHDPDAKDKRPELFFIFAYRIDGKTVRLYALDDEVFGDAVVAKKLQGTVCYRLLRCLGKYSSVTLTDSPQHVREFLAANKDKCFSAATALMILTREGPPSTKSQQPPKAKEHAATTAGKKARPANGQKNAANTE